MKLIWLVVLSCATSLFGSDWSLKDVTKGWNDPELVALYFHNSSLQTNWAMEALSHYTFSGRERVLDFGAGDGKVSAYISLMTPRGIVDGIDCSKEMISFSTKMYSKELYKNLSFHLVDNVNLDQTNLTDTYDLITSFCVFHVVPDPETVLSNLKSCLKKDGKLVATYPIGKNIQFFKAAKEEMAKRGWKLPKPTEGSIMMRDPNKVPSIFMSSGFTLEHFEVTYDRQPFCSREKLIDWLEGTLAANWNIPYEHRREFFTDLANRYLSYRRDDIGEDGFVYFSIAKITLIASQTAPRG